MLMAPPPTHALLPWLPGFPPWAFPTRVLLHIPSVHLSAVNSSPCPGIAPQSLNSSSQPLCHLGYVWQWQGLSDSHFISVSSVAQSCPTLCDPMDCNTPGLPVHNQLPEFIQTHVHWVSDAIQPSHPLPLVSGGELKQGSDPHIRGSESEEKHLRLKGKQLICGSLNGSRITADDDCSREIKRPLLPERKALLRLKVYS